MNVNFVSFVKLAVLSMPALARGGAASGHNSQIIVTSSGAGKLAVPKAAIYSGMHQSTLDMSEGTMLQEPSTHCTGSSIRSGTEAQAVLVERGSRRLEIENKRLPVTITNCILGQVTQQIELC